MKITILLLIILAGSGYLIMQDERKMQAEQQQAEITDENINIDVGSNWSPETDYTFTIKSVDTKNNPKKVWLILYKNGDVIDTKIVKEGDKYQKWNVTISHIYDTNVTISRN